MLAPFVVQHTTVGHDSLDNCYLCLVLFTKSKLLIKKKISTTKNSGFNSLLIYLHTCTNQTLNFSPPISKNIHKTKSYVNKRTVL